MTVISRLQLDHPALGTAGGPTLHAAVAALYKKLGDNLADRLFYMENLNDSAFVDCEHNFQVPFTELRYDLYLWVTGTGELTRITDVSTPDTGDFTVAAKVGDETTHIRVTNGSGAQRDLVLMVYNDPINLDELVDVEIATPANGEVLTWVTADSKWKNLPPAAAKDFNVTIGATGDYAKLSDYLADTPAAGDWLLILDSFTETADLTFATADVRISQRPGAIVTLSGALTNGIRMTADRIEWENMNVRLTPSGPQARGVSIEAADCRVSGLLRLNAAQTFTDPVHVTTAGSRAGGRLAVWKENGAAAFSSPLNNLCVAQPTFLDVIGG